MPSMILLHKASCLTPVICASGLRFLRPRCRFRLIQQEQLLSAKSTCPCRHKPMKSGFQRSMFPLNKEQKLTIKTEVKGFSNEDSVIIPHSQQVREKILLFSLYGLLIIILHYWSNDNSVWLWLLA